MARGRSQSRPSRSAAGPVPGVGATPAPWQPDWNDPDYSSWFLDPPAPALSDTEAEALAGTPAMALPDETQRVSTIVPDMVPEPADHVRTVMRRFARQWRVLGGQVGVYENGREHGYRITSTIEGGRTLWFAEYRNTDDIVVYGHGEIWTATGFQDLPGDTQGAVSDLVWNNRAMFRYGQASATMEYMAEFLGAVPVQFTPATLDRGGTPLEETLFQDDD